jgi:predicted metalloprotease with PDZ domain
MSRHLLTTAVLGAVLAVATVATVAPVALSQGPSGVRRDSVSAPITDVRYQVLFDRATAAQGIMAVEMRFMTDGSGPVLLSLPAWTTGAYEISNFTRRVLSFTAATEQGLARWDKLDHDTWRIVPAGAGQVTVAFGFIADTLDTAMSWSREDFLLFNGTNVFLYPEGRPLDFAATVTIRTEADWQVVTGMRPAGEPRTYTESSYHDLVDMPFFVGRMDVDSQQVAGRVMRLATYPAGSVGGAIRAQAWDQLRRVVPPMVAIFGDTPWEHYTVMQIVDSAFAGASGLEHQNSHVDILSPPYVGHPFQPSLYAHEIFHAWNVKRIRPAEMWPYQYDRAQPTPWLWVSEGITDYYADLALVRGGVTDAAGFYETTAGKINEVNSAPVVALEDASLETWVHPLDGSQYVYYPKGSLAGLMLDIMIRDASDNARSLDVVMRQLYDSTYRRGRGFTAADFWGAVQRAAPGRSFQEFYDAYIDGRQPYPWDEVLPLAGMRAVQERVPRIGVFTQQDATGILVTAVEPGGAADRAGVRAGDYLISIGGVAVADQRFGELFRARFGQAAEGTPLEVRVRRDTAALALPAQLQFAPGQVRIEPLPAASAKAVRIRQGILTGR